MDINTVYGRTAGWEKGEVAGSQYLPCYLHTHYTGERATGCPVEPLKCRRAMSAARFWQQFDRATDRFSVKIQV